LSTHPVSLWSDIYTVDDNDILVLAVAHLHRHPDYWRNRLKT